MAVFPYQNNLENLDPSDSENLDPSEMDLDFGVVLEGKTHLIIEFHKTNKIFWVSLERGKPCLPSRPNKYSRTSMARTPLGP